MVTVLNLFFTSILYIINVTRHYGVSMEFLPNSLGLNLSKCAGKAQMGCHGGSKSNETTETVVYGVSYT